MIREQLGQNGPFSNVGPSKENWINGYFGVSGFNLCCVANYDSARAEIVFGKADKDENKRAFEKVIAHREDIESAPPMRRGEWVLNQQLIDDSCMFAQCCRTLAGRLGVRFADAGDWDISLTYDGVHFTEQGHQAFAAGLLEVLK